MTENEAIERLRSHRIFMQINDCYAKENYNKFGELAFEANAMAIKALEEIQQYRAIGTVKEIKKVVQFLSLDNDNGIIEDLQLLNKYQFIGTVEECREARERQIVQKPNKRELVGTAFTRIIYHCPNCNKRLYDCAFKNGELDHVSPGSRKSKFCEDCGQKLDWSE